MVNETKSKSKDILIFDPLKLLDNFKKLLDSENELSFLKKNNHNIRIKLKDLFNLFNKADIVIKNAKKKLKDLIANKASDEEIADAEKEAGKLISEHLDWHDVHELARDLWKELMSAAIYNLDPSSKGNSKLFEYLEASSKFEDVLYGLEDYYRDHTLHSVWVYLMGVQLMCEGGMLSGISKKLNWYLYNDIETGAERYPYPTHFKNWAKIREGVFKEQLQYYTDSVWCIIALCHDLGYSLAKLGELNKRVADVLKYFHLPEFNRVGYSLDIEHQYLVEQFLEIMAMDVRIMPGEDYQDLEERNFKEYYFGNKRIFNSSIKRLSNDDILKGIITKIDSQKPDRFDIIEEIKEFLNNDKKLNERKRKITVDVIKDIEEQTLIKCYRDDSTYWRLCKALERKEHGILSAYLIYKTLGIFADTSVRGAAEDWGLEDQEVIYNIIRGDILFAIAQHEFAYTHLDQLGSLAEVLIVCDELEEFTRLGRKLQSRKYTDTTAETGIQIIPLKSNNEYKLIEGNPISLILSYKSIHENPEAFFNFLWRKLRRICTLYSLDQNRDTNEKVYFPIKEIKIQFQFEDSEFTSVMDNTIDNGVEFTSDLPPKAKIDKSGKVVYKLDQLNKYKLECIDDRIFILGENNKEFKEKEELKTWLGIKK